MLVQFAAIETPAVFFEFSRRSLVNDCEANGTRGALGKYPLWIQSPAGILLPPMNCRKNFNLCSSQDQPARQELEY
jgi:hypothetical protein